MISGVRASSTRIESTSSTIAKLKGRCTISSRLVFHVVAQIIETVFVVGAVGNVAAIGGLTLGIVEVIDDHADGEAEEGVDFAPSIPNRGGPR